MLCPSVAWQLVLNYVKQKYFVLWLRKWRWNGDLLSVTHGVAPVGNEAPGQVSWLLGRKPSAEAGQFCQRDTVTWPYAPCAVRTGLSEQRVWVNMERGRGEYQVQARVETGENPARPGEVTLPCRGAMAWWCRNVLPQLDQLFRNTPRVRCPWRGLRPLGDAQTALGAPKSCRLCQRQPLGSLWEEAMGKWEQDPWESSPVVSQARPGVIINSNKTLLVRKKTWLASHFELENELEMGDVKFHEQSLVSGQK